MGSNIFVCSTLPRMMIPHWVFFVDGLFSQLVGFGDEPRPFMGPLIYFNRLSSSAQACPSPNMIYIYIYMIYYICLFKKWGVNYTFTFTGIIINDPLMHLWEPIRNSQHNRWCPLAPGLSLFLGQGDKPMAMALQLCLSSKDHNISCFLSSLCWEIGYLFSRSFKPWGLRFLSLWKNPSKLVTWEKCLRSHQSEKICIWNPNW